MARPDPLQAAAAHYTAERWSEAEWRQLGRETGTSDILVGHSRLYRSLGFGDDDYPDAALDVLGRVLREGVGDNAGEAERMDLLVDSMPDLPTWTAEHAPQRTKRLFQEYLDARDPSEIPALWQAELGSLGSNVDPEEITDDFTPDRSIFNVITNFMVDEDEPVGQQAHVREPVSLTPAADPRPRTIFIVHGHDEAALNSVRVYVYRETGVMPISLAEEAGRGQTIIEKFEAYGEQASYVIVLLTPDDVGQTVANHDGGATPNPRARQNVVLELGYFIGAIGRGNITVVNAGVERPSDLAGLSYVEYPGTNWKDDLRRELLALGLTR